MSRPLPRPAELWYGSLRRAEVGMGTREVPPRKIFWGWYVVAGTFIIIGVNYGARYCFGVFLKPMCEAMGF